MKLFKNKKNKLFQKNISFILIIFMVFTILNLKVNHVNAETTKEIRILEIQSSENFILQKSGQISEYNVTVDQVGMPEFISRVDQLNGKYDIIVIGNKENAYTNPFSSKPNYIFHNGSAKLNGSILGSGSHIEYYPENDITNKRAEEIKEIINSGQLVYIEADILYGTSLTKTKLYSNFKDINKDNFKKVSVNNLSLNTIVKDYINLSYEFKKPIFELTNTPQGDSNNSLNLENRNMIFNGKITPINSSENLTVNLYLDINGDSLFRESDKELVATTEVNINNGQECQFQLNYTMPTDFIGQLDWKIEVERRSQYDNNVKSYKTGKVIYKSISGKKQKINVLQIYLDEKSQLSKNERFNELISGIDYDIDLKYYKLDDFNKKIVSGAINLDAFDMIIIGFDDAFYKNSLTDKASEKIKEFIKTGQSVMFTHDTINLNYHDNMTTQKFRDMLGQSRFTDKQYNFDEKDVFGNKIKHDIELEDELGNKWTTGYTKNHLDRYKTGKSNLMYSYDISEINLGLITQYPFNLSSSMKVQKTHGQYYQLNLEHPDLVPWYVFDDSYFTNNDARNNYYTYSIGNLTYSGTGHSNELKEYGEDEIKLFINTIVKAARGANSAPTIEALSDEVTEVSNKSDFEFNAIIKDFNGDKVRINEVIVGGILDSETGAVQNGTGKNIWEHENDNYYDSGTSFEIKIPKSILEENLWREINVTIKVMDDRGAKSEKTYKIKPVATPILKVYDYKFNGIAGELATIYMTMDKQNNDNSSIKIQDIKAEILENNFIDVNQIEVDENTNKIKITFKTKGIMEGESVDLNVTYKVGNENKSTTAKIILYTVESNEIPNIKVNLASEKVVNYSGEVVLVNYDIIPEEFTYIENGDNNTENKEVVFIIDTSKDIELGKIKNALINRMINYFLNGNKKNVKFNIVTYNSEVNSYIVDPNAKDNNGVLIDYRNELQNKINSILQSSSQEKKLGEAIKRAEEILSQSGDSNTLKNMIVIASGDPTDNFPNISKNSYNIITLALNKTKDYKNHYETLKNWHNLLGGEDNNYFISASDHNDLEGGTDIAKENPLAPQGDIMSVIAQRLEGFKNNSYIFNDVKLTFNLASNFDVIRGLQIENGSNYSIKIPEIIYKPVEQVSDNIYKYISSPIQVSFIIEPKEDKSGKLTFAENSPILSNYISYTTLDKKFKRKGIETPCIIKEAVNVSDLTHGLYGGLKNSSEDINKKIIDINENESEFLSGVNVYFGSSFKTVANKLELKLDIDDKFEKVSNIKVYKFTNNTLEYIVLDYNSIKNDYGNNFTIILENFNEKKEEKEEIQEVEMLITYDAKIKDSSVNERFINTITIGESSKSISIFTLEQADDDIESNLPDLF